jgi:hypothetical protein
MSDNWLPASEAPEGVIVETKIHDDLGVRNVTPPKRQRRLWFFPDSSMYVYYMPTHYRPVVTSARQEAE